MGRGGGEGRGSIKRDDHALPRERGTTHDAYKRMRCGLHCSYTLTALSTRLGRAEEFLGESIHPRWRTSVDPWSVYSAGLSIFDDHEREAYTDAFTGDLGDMDLDVSQDEPAGGTVSVLRNSLYVNCLARAMQWASAIFD